MKNLSILGVLLFLFCHVSFGQDEEPINSDMLPKFSSPEVSTLGKYISVPMSINTGTPNISIPIYTLQYGGMEVPITLSYEASGVKVEDIASKVGLKWTLNVGGAVTRIIKGAPDEGRKYSTIRGSLFLRGYYEDYGLTTLAEVFNNLSGDAAGTEYTYMSEDLSSGVKDGQPDLFSFNALGHSGRFFFNEQRQPVLFTEGDYKINETWVEFASDINEFSEWSIVAPSGIEMLFGNGNKESSYVTNGNQTNLYNDNAWFLSTIKNPSTNKQIIFEYQDEKYTEKTISNSSLSTCLNVTENGLFAVCGITGSSENYCFSMEANQLSTKTLVNVSFLKTKRIQRIIAGDTEIEFIGYGREDINALYTVTEKQPQRIELIKVKNNGICIKEFKLNYEYFISPFVVSSNLDQTDAEVSKKRLKLVSFEEKSCTSEKTKIHYFQYDEASSLPLRASFAKDKWGYYNGNNNNKSLYPKYFDCTTFSNIADRSVSPSHSKTGTLNKIIFPTGGFVKFEYENHKHSEVVTSNENNSWTWSPILNYNMVASTNNMEEFEFIVDENALDWEASIKLYNGTPWNTPQDNPCRSSGFETKKAYEIIDAETNEVIHYDVFGRLVQNSELQDTWSNKIDISERGSYKIRLYSISDASGSKCFTSEAIIRKRVPAPPPEEDFRVGGLRVKKIAFYDHDSSLLKQNSYEYYYPVLISNPKYLYSLSYDIDLTLNGLVDLTGIPDILNNASIRARKGTYLYINHAAAPYQLDFAGSHISYQKVIEYDGEGRTEYHYYPAKDYFAASGYSSSNQFPFKSMMQSSLAGKLIYKNIYDASGALKKKESFEYIIQNVGEKTDALIASRIAHGSSVIIPYKFYSIQPEKAILTKQISTTFFDDMELITESRYFYESPNHHQLTKTISTNSLNDSLISENYYPHDITGTYHSDLIFQHRIATPIQSKTYHNNKLLTTQRTHYGSYQGGNIIEPANLEVTKGENQTETRITYDAYDAHGNLLQYTRDNNIAVSFLWGYNGQYPVAKIEGATHASATALLNISILDNPASENILLTELEKLRSLDALVTAYTYKPLIGISSIKDPSGYITHYLYDDFNRLEYITDHNDKVLKKYEYHYCTGSEIIIENPVQIISFTSSNSTPFVNDEIVLTVNTEGDLGTTPQYKWVITNGSSILLDETTTGNALSVNLTSGYTGNINITVTVTNTENSSADSHTLNLSVAVVVPTANAGADQTITLPDNEVSLTGTGTNAVSYAWSKVSGTGGTITSPNAAATTVTGLTEGTYIFRLTTTSNTGNTATDEVTVTVSQESPYFINGSTTANCSSGATGTLIVNETGYKPKISVVTITSSGNVSGSVCIYAEGTTTNPIQCVSATTTSPYQEVTSEGQVLPVGTYNYEISQVDCSSSSGVSTFSMNNTIPAIIPTANAGANKTITLPDNDVSLTGTGTNAVSFAWSKVSGTGGTITNPNAAATTVTGLTEGTYIFRLTTTSSTGNTATDNVTITVNPEPVILTANAGADQTITLPDNDVSLTGTGTNAVSFAWSKVSGTGGTITSPNAAATTVTGLTEGTYVFRLTTTSNTGNTATDEVTVTVNPAPVIPTANAGADQTITLPDNDVSLTGTGTNAASFAWSKVSGTGGTITSPNAAATTVTGLTEGTYVFRLTTTSSTGNTATDEVTVTVNPAPVIPTANAGANQTITLPDNDVSLTGTGTNAVSFAWSKVSGTGGTITSPNAAATTVTGLTEGTYVFRLTTTSNTGNTATDEVTVTVNPEPPYSINGSTTANCNSGATGTLIVNETGYKPKISVVSITSSGNVSGSVCIYAEGTTTNPIQCISATTTTPYQEKVTIGQILPVGTYNYEISQIDCYSSSGVSTFSMTQ